MMAVLSIVAGTIILATCVMAECLMGDSAPSQKDKK